MTNKKNGIVKGDEAAKLMADWRVENEERLEKYKKEAQLIGKDSFNLEELKKYWSYRYDSSSTQEEIADAMQEIERDYYLAGDEFMTMEQYGKYLMRMELYR